MHFSEAGGRSLEGGEYQHIFEECTQHQTVEYRRARATTDLEWGLVPVVNGKPLFQRKEFDSPDEVGSGNRISTYLVMLLIQIRLQCGFPFIIDSGVRTAAHNQEVGGVAGSAHVRGNAVDVVVHNSHERMLLVHEAKKLGIRRIGIAKTYVHIDVDTEEPQDVMWTY